MGVVVKSYIVYTAKNLHALAMCALWWQSKASCTRGHP